MASMSIGRTAEFEEILLPHASLADRCWLRSRWRHRRSSAYGSQHEAEPNTFSGSGVPTLPRSEHGSGARRCALEAPPCRSAGQAKRRAHLPKEGPVRRWLGERAASQRTVHRSRPSCQPVPAGVQSKPWGQEYGRRETSGVKPHESIVLQSPESRSSLAGPSSASGSPSRAGVVRRQSMRELSRLGSTAFPPFPGGMRTGPAIRPAQSFQKRCSSKATFLVSRW